MPKNDGKKKSLTHATAKTRCRGPVDVERIAERGID